MIFISVMCLDFRFPFLQSILETEARAAEDDLTRYETELKRREEETNAARKSLDELRHQQSAALQRRDQLNDARRARWKEQAALTREVSEKKEQLRKAEGALYSTLSRSTAAGLAVLHRVVQQHNIQGVYGPLIDLIQCDQRYDKSVETVAGNKLFQIVVDSDDTVDRLLSLMKQERAGRLTFMPLNRLLVEEVQYPTNTDQAIPLILQLRFEPKFRPAVMQVFGSTLLARNLQVGAELSKTHNFDCITLDGDQVNRRGAFTGGFIDSRRSRMEAHKSIKTLTAEVASLSAKAESAKAEEQRADQEITTLLGDQQKCDAQQAKLRDQLKSVSGDMESARRRKVAAAENFNKLNEQAAKALKTASDLDERLAALKEEMKAPFIDLTPAEQAELDSLGAQELDLQQRLSAAARQRASSEAEIKKLENALATNLRRRLNELKARLSTAEDDEAASALETARHDLGLAQKELDELETKLKDLEQELENKTNAARAIEAEREKQQHDEAKGMNSLQSSMQEIEKVMSKQSLVQQQRDDCLRKIRELGSLPAEAHQDELRQMGAKELTAKLTKNLKQMEKFKNVNRKAIDQFMQLNDKRAELVKKKEELDKGKKAIEDLIGNLDMKKDEAILRTFKGISKNFTEVFRELVPGGKAILRMEKKAVKKQGEQESEEIDDNTAATGPLQYHGVEINVSFSGSDQAFEMQQLSGGQKTVVALALIFAIQRCDPSPFYVFDEIDAALDPLYRTAVANMLSEHRKTTQFIVTTFRPELLEAADRFLLVRFEAKISLVAEAQKEAVTRVLRAVEEEYERASAAAGAR
jgi:structural maintenance of chromosome 3 (chondroitin sulfate proteoglycan 6)